ncbi:hypothetical protein Ssi03_43950 [Sphaerisporangium siamense]|uniref:Uncharacterized protein n=1 Tax=Sphaerisporangium siamense TaxID=795645 RepID=A0A7W7GBW6_9ACTN|nr:hypothetical protein [Sphaerisporangium siamense]MBB4705443.1 hypothetical protein [Sphaerisporangium siamense]GII86405.1 hypothetical protein Ssi03_43950 [Sphaerisporangium siamense]
MTPVPGRAARWRAALAVSRRAARLLPAVLVVLAVCGVPELRDAGAARDGGGRDAATWREEMRADCMRRHGFRYVPTVGTRANPIRRDAAEARARDMGEYPALRRFRQKYGFGVFALYAYPREFGNPMAPVEEPLEPNVTIRLALSPTQLHAYQDADDACYAEAVKTVTGKKVTSRYDHLTQADARIKELVAAELDTDPRLTRLGARMAACLRRAGHAVPSATPSALVDRGPAVFLAEERRLGRRMQEPDDRVPETAFYAPPLLPQDARPYLAREIAAALADLECGRDFYAAYEPRRMRMEHRAQAEFGLEAW